MILFLKAFALFLLYTKYGVSNKYELYPNLNDIDVASIYF